MCHIKKRWFIAGALSAALLSLYGCAIPDTLSETRKVASDAATLTAKSADQAKFMGGAVERYDFPKLAGHEVEIEQADMDSLWLNEPIEYTSYSQNIKDIVKDLSERLKISIRLTQSLVENRSVTETYKPFTVQYKGSIRGLFDQIAARADIFWRNKNGVIEFFDTETRTYHLAIPRSTRTMSGTISLGSAGGMSGGGGAVGGGGMGGSAGGGMGGSSGGAQTSVTSNVNIDTFSAAIEGVRSIVKAGEGRRQSQSAGSSQGGAVPMPNGMPVGAPGGMPGAGAPGIPGVGAPGAPMPVGQNGDSFVTGTPELGLITVTTRPPVHDRVAAFIKTLNEGFAQNVFIQVRVLSVNTNNDFNAGIMANLVSAKGGTSVSTSNTTLSPASGNPAGVMTFSKTSGQFSGAQIVAQALAEIGNVSVVNSGQVIAVNGQPAAIQVASTQSYLASTTPAAVVTGGINAAAIGTAGLTPSSVTVGFTGSFLPMIMVDNRILLEYTINLSSLTSMGQITSGGQTIQLPNINQQSLQQQAFVNDGETIVLFGFDQDSNSSTDQAGLPAASINRNRSRQSLVIVMDVSRLKGLAK